MLWAVGALFAGAFAASRQDAAPPVSLSTASAAPDRPRASEKSGGAAPESASPILIGDRTLRGELDLAKMVLEGDSYYVPLSGGRRAILTLEPALQAAAEKVLAQAHAPRAAIVVMSPDGRLLAFAGRRNEEPALERDFSLPGSTWAPAASVFKIVTTAALIEAGVGADTKVCYHGGIRSVDQSNLEEDPRRDFACESLTYGLSRSQNAIMAKLFHKHLDRHKLTAAARKFGLGRGSEFAIPSEPSRFSFPEDPLELARVAAGFWSTEISALGGAELANVLASGGDRVTPRIVSEIRSGDRVTPVVGEAPTQVLSPAIASQMSEMLVATTQTGTAVKGFKDGRGQPYLPVRVAGKTGSLARGTPSYLSYSWFVGFAPAEKPEYVISVLLGNPEKWYLKAHTAARMVLQAVL